MSLLQKIPTILGAGGGVPKWRRHLQPCEWVETDGNCYIKLDHKINTITEIEGEFSQIVVPENYATVIGGGSSDGTLQINVGSDMKYYFRCWSNTNATIKTLDAETNENVIFKITKSPKQITINNTNFSFTNSIVNVNNYLYVFASYFSNYSPYLFVNNCGLKIKNLQSNVFNLIACYVIDSYTDNKGNTCTAGVAGIVDTLTGVFYTNDGSGNFTHGSDINI